MNSDPHPKPPRRAFRSTQWAIIYIPLGLLLLGTILFRWTDWDLRIQRLFYEPGNGWTWADHPLAVFLYDYGTIPALSAGILGGLIWAAAWFKPAFKPFSRAGLFAGLLLAVGPWLLVNEVFKEHFGRPRPREIRQFGGDQEFHRLWQPGIPHEGASFPSGHASMGFYWLGLFVFYHRGRPTRAKIFLAAGLAHGCLMGFGRMVQGAHFASDVLWSAGFDYLTALGLYYGLKLKPEHSEETGFHET